MRANARTGADLELGGRAILQLYRIPHILEGDSLDLLVDVVDNLIFGLLTLVTARTSDCRQELREAGMLVALVLVMDFPRHPRIFDQCTEGRKFGVV